MRTLALTAADNDLVLLAREAIVDNYEYGRHHIGAAVRMRDGRAFAGIHVEANVGRVTLCGEAVALGVALSAGARDVQAVVAVAHPHPGERATAPWVVTPCGMCRELISDFGPDACVIIPRGDNCSLVKVPVLELLPVKYAKGREPSGPQTDSPRPTRC